jgi:hypothetical protein
VSGLAAIPIQPQSGFTEVAEQQLRDPVGVEVEMGGDAIAGGGMQAGCAGFFGQRVAGVDQVEWPPITT